MSEHIHKVRRRKYKTGTYYFKCETCTFTITASQFAGHITVCWRCNQPFRVTRNDTRWARPVCQNCRAIPSLKQDDKLDDLLNDIVKV
jgi:hypothetical protein